MSVVSAIFTSIHFAITNALVKSKVCFVYTLGYIWIFLSSLVFIFVILASIVLSGSPEAANAWALNYTISWVND